MAATRLTSGPAGPARRRTPVARRAHRSAGLLAGVGGGSLALGLRGGAAGGEAATAGASPPGRPPASPPPPAALAAPATLAALAASGHTAAPAATTCALGANGTSV